MEEQQPERPTRPSLKSRFIAAGRRVGSTLTDPAALVYRRETHGRGRARGLLLEIFLFVREVAREFYEVDGAARADGLAYTTLLSLIPLLVAFTQVLQQYFRRLFPDYQTQIDNILNVVIPYQSPQLSYHLARFAENASAASTFGAIVFMIVAFRLFLAVEGTINQIWKVRSNRGYPKKIIVFTMLFFWGPLLMGLSFTTTNTLQHNPYLRTLFRQDFFFTLGPIVILCIAFAMLFWLVPSTRVQFRSALVGGVVAAALFSLVRFGFGIYADSLFRGRLNLIYGTVGLIVVFLLALEAMWIVILLGVEISYVHQNLYSLLRASGQQATDEPRFDVYFAIRALIDVARRFVQREDAPSADQLSRRLGATDSQMLRITRRLGEGKLLKETGDEPPGFVPGGDPDQITVEEVVKQMEGGHRAIPDIADEPDERAVIAGLFDLIGSSTSAALGQKTIGDLVRELNTPRNQPSRIEERFRREP